MRRNTLLPLGVLTLTLSVGTGCKDAGATAQSAATSKQGSAPVVALPNRPDSYKFAVLGDFGTGKKNQYELAEQMVKLRDRFKFGIVILVGDNLYGSDRPQDYQKKFEIPYKGLLDAGVKFYGSLGNHDAREQRFYNLFNMQGKLYYTFNPQPDVRFFALESTYPDPEQFKWLEHELKASSSNWKILFFHHPLYSSGERHGSDVRLREAVEPLAVKYNVSVVFNGHDHFYERIKPQKDITYFVTGSGGQLREGNIDRSSGLTAAGFDTDLAFLGVEISGDQMFFNAISRTGAVVDSGVVNRRKAAQ
ncbi:MAG: metallophosphoesterase [Vicinamibacterales bacterium]